MENLSEFRLDKLPDSLYCIPDFVSKNEEQITLKKIYEAPKIKWTHLLNRRLQNWGGLPKEKGMLAEDIPDWLQQHIDRIHNLGIFEAGKKPNHVLVNEYLPGQGISPHLDGNLFHPIIATISLGSHTILNYYEPLSDEGKLTGSCPSLEQRLAFQVLVPQRSLLLVQHQMFSHFLHGIAEIKRDNLTGDKLIVPDFAKNMPDCLDRQTRVSLTIRHVPNTKRIKIRL